MRPAILRAEEKLVQPVGEFHHLERISNFVCGPDCGAVPPARNADYRPFIRHYLGVDVVEHQAPIGIVSQPPGAADAPIRRSLRGDAVPWDVVQRHVGAVRLLERDVAVEAVVPAAKDGDLAIRPERCRRRHLPPERPQKRRHQGRRCHCLLSFRQAFHLPECPELCPFELLFLAAKARVQRSPCRSFLDSYTSRKGCIGSQTPPIPCEFRLLWPKSRASPSAGFPPGQPSQRWVRCPLIR